MLFWKILLFGSWALIVYNYAGYAVIALIINRIFPVRGKAGQETAPYITFIVAAYNEQDVVGAKVANCLAQDYPPSRIEWLFVTDGSSDNTPSILSGYPQIRLLHRPERLGKSAALNRGIAEASHPIIIASDANTFLNPEAVSQIAAHYADPRVGGVAGEKKVVRAGVVGEGEGLYWKYESALKRIDSAFYSVVGAAGELFSFRKELFAPVDPSVILDDFVISMRVAQQGYRVLYEPGAVAEETPSFSLEEEKKRKVRIAAGGFQSVVMLGDLLAFWKYPRLSFLYISHRVLRWVASPFCLVLSILAGAVLWLGDPDPVYGWLWAGQVVFYGLGLLSGVLPAKGPLKVAKLPGYFLFMNVSVIQGFFRWIRGGQSGVWEKARRA
jgi:poly-beta-1,6-N-acetyl-D-glucosamine synthase